MSEKVKKLYYSISEVSEMTGLKQYVLRYWETEFSNLKPQKNKAGNRAYRESDIAVVREIKRLLYDERFTIEGARQYFKGKKARMTVEPGEPAVAREEPDLKVLRDLKAGLDDLLKTVREYKN
ncbi:MAG: MerR family transcriptional regulator [FCB group bacterium]|nr:MerR family transcriptional regulator [FCB group bacterium]